MIGPKFKDFILKLGVPWWWLGGLSDVDCSAQHAMSFTWQHNIPKGPYFPSKVGVGGLVFGLKTKTNLWFIYI